MSWRVVVVSNSAKIDFRTDYLVVRSLEQTSRIHISEIAVLVVESTAVSLTAYALCELTENKVKVIFCDGKRNPHSELVPCSGCHDSADKVRKQIAWPQEHKQVVWTAIVREKITRQRNHLAHRGVKQAQLLSQYIDQLEFNDQTNREGHAAKVYFNALFGLDFSRQEDNCKNAALNYGYAIVLSTVNREIAAAGYINQLGLFHNNTFNAFNFGCDLMEPLRPLVDAAVVDMNLEQFGSKQKMELVGLLNREVMLDGTTQRLLYAIRLYCNSVFKAIQSADVNEICWVDYGV